ncbi:STAS domain-containing protein [Nocardia sp. NPDC058666]|uniref:STAS domain-containing protein n=1 Tax=Nocardia sp. NPDC058666 TaxID=3346587 RepID=UPI00364D0271
MNTQISAQLRTELTLHHAATVLHVYGEVDACTLPQWRTILDEAMAAEGDNGHLVIDIREVTFMSCRAIMDMATRAQQGRVRLSVVNPVAGVTNRIIVAAGLTAWLPVFTTRTQALAATVPALPLPSRQPPVRLSPLPRTSMTA